MKASNWAALGAIVASLACGGDGESERSASVLSAAAVGSVQDLPLAAPSTQDAGTPSPQTAQPVADAGTPPTAAAPPTKDAGAPQCERGEECDPWIVDPMKFPLCEDPSCPDCHPDYCRPTDPDEAKKPSIIACTASDAERLKAAAVAVMRNATPDPVTPSLYQGNYPGCPGQLSMREIEIRGYERSPAAGWCYIDFSNYMGGVDTRARSESRAIAAKEWGCDLLQNGALANCDCYPPESIDHATTDERFY